MKSKILLLVFSILFLWICPISGYVELNELIIIDQVKIKCNNDQIYLTLREIIPKNNDNDIQYKYKYYKKDGNDLNMILKELEDDNSKKFYYSVKRIKTNCDDISNIKNIFHFNHKKIRKF